MALISGTIHNAKLANSSRLKLLLQVLSNMEWHSTADLSHSCHNYAVATSISELRANGIAVESRRVTAEISKSTWWEYRLGRG